MINKHSIYNWLFFPLLALLLASGVASCSNDPAMEEEKRRENYAFYYGARSNPRTRKRWL